MKVTPYNDVNNLLDELSKGLQIILGENLVGLYLTGSLTYGDFDRGSSDIDFLAVIDNTLTNEELSKITQMHLNTGKKYPHWRKRVEGSYITKEMLMSVDRPKEPRPYVNANKMYNLVYGNEWVLNLYVLHEYGITLFGTDIKKLIKPVEIKAVRDASRKNLLEEWQPKLKELAPFEEGDYNRDHLQAYAILTMCRILYTANNNGFVSKKAAATWVKDKYGKPWSELIEKAENWKHGKEMNVQVETLRFIEFVIEDLEKKSHKA